MRKPVTPSHVFGCSEDALETVCQGCSMESGWVFGVPETTTPCSHMILIQDDYPGSILEEDGLYGCSLRVGGKE